MVNVPSALPQKNRQTVCDDVQLAIAIDVRRHGGELNRLPYTVAGSNRKCAIAVAEGHIDGTEGSQRHIQFSVLIKVTDCGTASEGESGKGERLRRPERPIALAQTDVDHDRLARGGCNVDRQVELPVTLEIAS